MMKTFDDTIHVAMLSDDNYAHHLAVAICSILKNLSNDRTLCVYALHEKLSDATRKKIAQLKTLRSFQLNFINVSCEKYEPFKAMKAQYIPRLAYARYYLPYLLPNLSKCLYLDTDILVRQDLGVLWDIQLPAHTYLGAVEEPAARFRNRDLGIPESSSYFNAGVLMLDLEKLRNFHLEEKAFNYLKEKGSLLYGDQDVLNALFFRSWHALPLKWNVHSHVFLLRDRNEYYRYSVHETRQVFNEVALVHFSHRRKPDSLISQHPYRDEYWKYMRYTAWKHSLPKDVNLVNLITRIYWELKSLAIRLPILFHGIRAVKRAMTGYYHEKEHSR